MKKKVSSGMMLTLLFVGMLTLAFNIQPVKTDTLTDEYYSVDGDSLDIGFSKYGEMISYDEATGVGVGLQYPGYEAVGTHDQTDDTSRDPFANEGIPVKYWLNGWLLEVQYTHKTLNARRILTAAMFTDTSNYGGDWIVGKGLPLYTAPYGGRKTTAYAETEAIQVLHDDPQHFIALCTTHIYDWEDSNEDEIVNHPTETWSVVDVMFTIVFNKVEKSVIVLKDVKLAIDTEILDSPVDCQFSTRGEWNLGFANYVHFYHDPSGDIAQVISSDLGYVGWAAFWPHLSDYTVHCWGCIFDPLIEVNQSDMIPAGSEPSIPFIIGEWDFTLDYVDPFVVQFRGATVYGISDLSDGDDKDIGPGHENVIDSEVVFDFLVNPIADFTYAPEKLFVNQEVTFNSTSFDIDGYIVSWEWDFNNDSVIDATTENATWTYTEARNYTVTLIVTDNDGRTDSRQRVVGVYLEHELVVSIMAPASILIPHSSLLNATVTNEGLSDEVDVELSLYINDSIVDSSTVPVLEVGHSSRLSYLWTPTIEGTYNLTAYAPPTPGEVFIENNQKTVFSRAHTWEGETIYIRPDGSIDPPSAPILRDGDLYTLTGNIFSNADGIVIERDNITLDGAGYTVQGRKVGFSEGISLSHVNNVTIKNTKIKDFGWSGITLTSSSNNTIYANTITNNTNIKDFSLSGIYLFETSNNTIYANTITNNGGDGVLLSSSSNNTVSGNNITNNNWDGVRLCYWSSNNTVSGNTITYNNWDGISLGSSNNNSISQNNIAANNGIAIYLSSSSNNSISQNNITNNNWDGILLDRFSNYNTVSGNNITNNNRSGVYLYESSDNMFYHNNFIDNTQQVHDYAWDHPWASPSLNTWDTGYPSGGNYWSDYEGSDMYSGPYQNETGSDGIGDTPYVIDGINQDNFPLVNPWSPAPPVPATIGELKTKIEELGSEGEIDNQGIVNSLLAKLNVAQKLVDKGKIDEVKSILEEDFIPQVQNLSGIHITPEAAELLIESAEHIISNL